MADGITKQKTITDIGAEKAIGTSLISSYFQLLYQLIKDNNMTQVIYVLCMVVQTAQIQFFKFHDLVQPSWSSGVAEYTGQVLGYINFPYSYRYFEYELFQMLFYITFGLICLWAFLTIFSVFIIMNQKSPGQMIISLVRLMNNAIPSILYVPFLYTMAIMLNCNNSGYMVMFTNQICWQGIIIINEVIAITGIILLFLLQALNSLFYYDPLYNEKKTISKRNGRCVTLYWIHVTATVLLTSLLPYDKSALIFIIVFQIFGAMMCFLFMKHNDTFNHRLIQRIWLASICLDLWSSTMLGVSELVEGRIMIGSAITWLFCVPLVLGIQLLSKQKREESLMINLNKFDSPTQLVDHANEVLKLVEFDKRKLPQGQLLNGYIEFHNQTCANPLCPLKKIKFSLNLFKARNDQVVKTDKRHALVYDTMSRLFMLGIGKFPDEIYMRIAYSMYTLRVLKSKQQALEELNEAEKYKPSLDIQFILYYIKKVIEAEISELSGEGQDFTEQKDYESKLNEFKNAMERSVALLMEFWSQFSDEKPDLLKLYEIGSKLFPIRMYVDQIWKKISRSENQQVPKALRLYSKYLMDIFNDRVAGMEMLEKARKIENQFQQRKAFKLGLSSNFNIDGQEDGCIFISLEEDRFGMVYAINMSAASMFGFDKSELTNKKINNIMPSLFAVHHDDFLKRFLDTNEATLLNKERTLFGKHKNGYIFPFVVLLRPVYHVLKDGVEFVGTLKKEKRIRDVSYLVCNKELIVEDLSAACINLIGIDMKALSLRQIRLTDLFGEMEDQIVESKAKGGRIIDYTFPKVTDDQIQFGKSDRTVKLLVQCQPINFLIMKTSESDQGLAGYQVKIERAVDANQSHITQQHNFLQNNLSLEKNEGKSEKQRTAFQFRPQILTNKKTFTFVGETTDLLNYSEMFTNILDSSIHEGGLILARTEAKQDQVLIEEIKDERKIDYAEGIRILRLFDGQVLDIDKFGSEDFEQEDEMVANRDENKLNQEKAENHGEVDEDYAPEGGFRSSKDLQEALNTQSESKAVRCLWYTSTFLYLILIVLCAINNQFERNEIYGSIDIWKLMINQGNMLSELNILTGYSRELFLLNVGIHDLSILDYETTIETKAQKIAEETEIRRVIGERLVAFSNVSKAIFNSQAISDTVEMFTSYDQSTSNVMDYATQQLISKFANVQNKNLSLVLPSDVDYFFVFYNSFNDYCQVMLKVYNEKVSEATGNMDALKSQSLTILIVSACVMFFSSILLTVFLNKTLNTRQEILKIFLDIPEKTAKHFYSKCENFLQQIGSNDDDEVASENEMFMEDKGGQEESVSLLGRKKKRFKNNEHKNFGFFFKMVVVAGVIESYFILIYFLDDVNLVSKSNIINEFNQTSLAQGYYAFVVNAQKQVIINSSSTLLNSKNTNNTINELYQQIYQLDTLHQMYHSIDVDYNLQEYKDYFNTVMFDDVCSILIPLKVVSKVQCEQFGGGILKHGLMTSISRHFQNIRHLQNHFDYIYQNPTDPFPQLDTDFTVKTVSSNITYNNMLNILRLPESYEINEMMNIYLKESFLALQAKYLHVMTINQEQFLVQQLIIMILFLITLGFALMVCWNPFLNKLNKEIWSTKCLLTFIPLDEIAKIRTISNYIRTVILEHNI